MNILVTGAKGFIGQNLIASLRLLEDVTVNSYDQDTDVQLLYQYCKDADLIYHLAGTNRPKDNQEFIQNNSGFTEVLIEKLKILGNSCPIIFSSSIQATLDNPYGKSKKVGEELLLSYGKDTGARIVILRIPNVFGKWCRPNYNSVIATLSYNIIHDLPITIHDPHHVMNLIYIDDLIDEMIKLIELDKYGYHDFTNIYTVTLQYIVDLMITFKDSRENKRLPNLSEEFSRKLYSTYISYLPDVQLKYELMTNIDERGSFTEFIKGETFGQLSVNRSKPGIIKGNHWHKLKHERFLVVSGEGVIRLRKINTSVVITIKVDGEMLEVVDVPAGYVHNIENIGSSDMIILIWANEIYDSSHPDTYYMEV